MAPSNEAGEDVHHGTLSPRARRIKRLLPYWLLLGLGFSACSAVVFHYVMSRLPPNPLYSVQFWTFTSSIQWIPAYKAYFAWSTMVYRCFMAYDISAVAAIGFAVAIGVCYFPKAAIVTAIVLLNVLFAWTSHVFSFFSAPVASAVANWVTGLDDFLWKLLELSRGGSTNMVADTGSLAMLALLAGMAFLYSYGKGKLRALGRSVQVFTGLSMILPVEILLCDGSEFNLHVTQVQAVSGFAAWFTNADLLYCGGAIFVASSLALYLPRLHHTVRHGPL